jgi:hypothetical protein
MTDNSGSMKIMILEYNTFPDKECLKRGIPPSFPDDYWGKKCPYSWDLCPRNKKPVSDHRPYYVRVKIK